MLIAKRVTGEEEVPEGVVAVLTPDAPDVLSHVSVRARNMKASTCQMQRIYRLLDDFATSIEVWRSGSVSFLSLSAAPW